MGLLPGQLTPWLAEGLVRLGTGQPFARACQTLAHFTGTTLSAATARRLTERAGAAWVQLELAAVARLEADPAAEAPAGPPRQQVSVDGVFVPLVGGDWKEVKVLAVGAIAVDGADGARATDLSYLARLADHERFGREILAELHRRGTLAAPTVVAVADGAAWIQGVLDQHLPGAARVLDFVHATGYLAHASQAACGTDSAEARAWLAEWRHELRHGDPDAVLAAVADLPASAARDDAIRYLTARRPQIRYAEFAAAGYPIGSGCVESAAKSLVQGRLCGAGMRWAEDHVDGMLGLRAIVGTDRWTAGWERIVGQLRQDGRLAAGKRRATRRARLTPAAPTPAPVPAATPPALDPAVTAVVQRLRQAEHDRPKLVVAGRPTADHPFKRSFHARQPRLPALPPKL